MQPLVIPTHLDTEEGTVTLERAWFERIDDGLRRLSFEGHDEAGALRAGLVWFDDDARPARTTLTPYGRDKKLPALQGLLAGGELLVHRAGRRAVVRTTDGFTKALRPSKLAEAEARARAFQAVGGWLRTPHVLGASPEGELTVDVVPGTSLHQLGSGRDEAAWEAAWGAWATAWPEWVRTPGLGTDLPRYGVEHEEQTLTGWLLRVELARPAGLSHSSLRERFGGVMERLNALPDPRWCLSHRDLHDKQVLVTLPDARAGLIDSDTLALSDAALDLGNLLAHVRLREVQGSLDPSRADAAERLIRTVADELEVPDDALSAWCEAASLRLSCVYAFRPAGTAS
ncbi:MAG TPA: hypothetical protein GX013_08030 [Propionibacterium sp.]|nr:hypothetical protein [Propionibacterium sp.]